MILVAGEVLLICFGALACETSEPVFRRLKSDAGADASSDTGVDANRSADASADASANVDGNPDPATDAGETDAISASAGGCAEAVLLPRTGWTATARRYALYTGWGMNDHPSLALDDLPGSRYSSGFGAFELGMADRGEQFPCATTASPSVAQCSDTNQGPEDFFQVDFGRTERIRRIVMDSSRSPKDHPSRFVVQVSQDGVTFNPVTEAVGAPVSDLCFETQEARYLRVRPTEVKDEFWFSIHDFNVFGSTTP